MVQGVAFEQLPRLPMCLAVTLYGDGQAVTLLAGDVDGTNAKPLPSVADAAAVVQRARADATSLYD
jgi:hypothetical protein